MPDRDVVVRALRTACESVGVRPRRVALVVPDLVGKVSLVRVRSDADAPRRSRSAHSLADQEVHAVSDRGRLRDATARARRAPTATSSSSWPRVARSFREYEGVCEEAGIEAGLVDLATIGVVNLFLSSGPAANGDWLVVHMRPEYTSIVIMRGEDMIFFRNRAEGRRRSVCRTSCTRPRCTTRIDSAAEASRACCSAGSGSSPGRVDMARRDLEEHMGTQVEPIDPTRGASLTDRIQATPELMATLSPLVGMLLRTRREAVSA